MIKQSFCTKCVYPEAAVNLEFDDDGVCSSCAVFEDADEISSESWSERKKKLVRRLYRHCDVPVMYSMHVYDRVLGESD